MVGGKICRNGLDYSIINSSSEVIMRDKMFRVSGKSVLDLCWECQVNSVVYFERSSVYSRSEFL